jgi:hypothetical protein
LGIAGKGMEKWETSAGGGHFHSRAEEVHCTLFFTEREFTRSFFHELEFDFISVVEEWGQMKNLLVIFKFN